MVGNNLKSGKSKVNCQNRMIFTESGIFTVPDGITQIFVSGCASGGDGVKDVNGKAGGFCIRQKLLVVSKQAISIVVGKGNTIVGTGINLIANSTDISVECQILGFKSGISTYLSDSQGNAPSGAFGFGGGKGGTSVGLSGGGENMTKAGLGEGAYYGEIVTSGAISGKVYGSTKGGESSYKGSSVGNGSSAGGYGAGGGGAGWISYNYNNGTYGTPGLGSPGIVIIEW